MPIISALFALILSWVPGADLHTAPGRVENIPAEVAPAVGQVLTAEPWGLVSTN